MSNKLFGRYGELLAQEYLQKLGYKILEVNFSNKLGEIDLIVQDGRVICFVEVKSRQSIQQGHPLEAITPWKVRKLSQMAVFYLKHKHGRLDASSRFDVISIIRKEGGVDIKHVKNAFECIYR